jgi:hypothetical protein
MPTCPNCQHSWDNTPPATEATGRYYTSFLTLADDVLTFVRETQRPIISADDPFRRLIGFQTPERDRSWLITLSRLKDVAWATAEASSRLGFYRSYMPVASGRATIAALWSEGREPTEPFHGGEQLADLVRLVQP